MVVIYGLDVRELAEDDDPVFVVCSVSVDYHYPARLHELVSGEA
ncbi:MAG: hypothetical protein ACNYPI_08970 [Arenicellales bacterium WSBS_2016_MAG_OTU3]